MNSRKLIYMACDHAGYELKEKIKEYLSEKKYEITDFGTFSKESVDYPDFIHPLAKKINENKFITGIIICGTGNGVAITANKYKNIRAALCWENEIARMARLHNDANILALPTRFINEFQAKEIVDIFLNTDFEGGRHEQRIKKIIEIQ